MNDVSAHLLQRYRSGERSFAGEDLTDLHLPGEILKDSNFSGCMFADCRIAGSVFDGSNFTGAEFDGCNAIEASFVRCDFTDAFLMESALGCADFFQATFDRVRLMSNCREAFFVLASFTDSAIVGVRFDAAIFGYTRIERSILSACSFPDVRVVAPCDIDAASANSSIVVGVSAVSRLRPGAENYAVLRKELFETLNTTRSFFARTGVDIEHLKSYSSVLGELPNDAIEVFLSYSSADEGFAEALYVRLRELGVRTWMAPHALRSGRHLSGEISEAIGNTSNVILILSQASMSSNWVATELRATFEAVRSGTVRRLHPVRLAPLEIIETWSLNDAESGTDLAQAVRENTIHDFTGWRARDAMDDATSLLIAGIYDSAPLLGRPG
jgi:uncharacterized protein YjbI with pentapeptide repeats